MSRLDLGASRLDLRARELVFSASARVGWVVHPVGSKVVLQLDQLQTSRTLVPSFNNLLQALLTINSRKLEARRTSRSNPLTDFNRKLFVGFFFTRI